MSSFDAAIKVVLAHEGGWCDVAGDLGGETNFGISTKFIREAHITPAFLGLDPSTAFQPGWLKAMKVDAAVEVYRSQFWNPGGYGELVDQTIATKIFDCGVNCGPPRAHAMAQRAAAACNHAPMIDGIMGSSTRAAINACEPKAFLAAMAEQMRAHYEEQIRLRPINEKFRHNWMQLAAWGT